MENLINERIKSVLDLNAKTPNGLANMVEMVPSTVSRQIKGDIALSAKLIEGFLRTFPDVSAEWLLRGEGSMYRTAAEEPPGAKVVSVADSAVWRAKYEAIKECYDALVATLAGGQEKRSANVG